MLQGEHTDVWQFFQSIAQWMLSAVGGALVVLVTFRTRLALIDKEIELRKAENEKHERETNRRLIDLRNETTQILVEAENRLATRLGSIDRRQTFMLEIMADFARQSGTDKRLGDRVLTFLADEMRTTRDD